MRDVLVFAVLRLGLFALVWWLLMLAGLNLYLAGIASALISMLISILALRPARARVAERWQAHDEERRARRGEVHDEDAEEEDELIDSGADPSRRARDRADEVPSVFGAEEPRRRRRRSMS